MSLRMRIPRPQFFATSWRRTVGAAACSGAFAVLMGVGPASLPAQGASDASQHFVVVIDAAHGGDDSGARLGSEAEKAYTLAFSVRLRSLLAARGVSVVTTRESDATIDADHRADIANRATAHACLSLHASESGNGIHLFVSSLAPVQPAHFLPWRTAQAAWITRSVSLAGIINSAINQAGISVTLGRSVLPVVDSMTCPAVVIEVAPLQASSDSKPASLDDQDYQARVAGALAAALVEWRSSDRGGR